MAHSSHMTRSDVVDSDVLPPRFLLLKILDAPSLCFLSQEKGACRIKYIVTAAEVFLSGSQLYVHDPLLLSTYSSSTATVLCIIMDKTR